LHERLKPGGRALIQVITIAEHRYGHYRETPDFIQQCIFPGGMLPTATIMRQQAAAAGLAIRHVETFAPGYAATLAEWRRRFHARWTDIARLGFDERFRRLWDYYLAYCEAGFATGQTDVGLYVLERAPA
jgi:cyclopropane-fatty-acyl-phospholipid synthase